MSDLVKRLRNHALPDPYDEREVMHAPLLREAADLIEALVKERQDDVLAYNTLFGELQAALEELAALRKQIDELQPVAWFYCEHGEEYFGHPDGYRPDYAVALYSLGGIKK